MVILPESGIVGLKIKQITVYLKCFEITFKSEITAIPIDCIVNPHPTKVGCFQRHD